MDIWQELDMRPRLAFSLVFGPVFLALLSGSLLQMIGAAVVILAGSLVYQYGILLPFLKKAPGPGRNQVFAKLRVLAYVCIAITIYLVLKLKNQPISEETITFFTVSMVMVLSASSALTATVCCKRSFDRHTN